ncbi:MAG: CRISPR-associated helicase Cas3' [Methylococcaceae bacterium]|nr:CRISPR-associated helicase Cas3' [Methylococcaceae bacterium]
MTTALYFKYWGKASKEDSSYHLLPYHCLDVAAVGYLLLSPSKLMCKNLAAQLQVEPIWLRDFFVFCLALHDLGKFSRSFQGLSQGLSDDLVKKNQRMPYEERHDSLGFWAWIKVIKPALAENFLSADFSDKEAKVWLKYCDSWMEIVTGHHGMPPKRKPKSFDNYFQSEDSQAVLKFTQDTFELLLNDFDFRPLLDKELKKRLQAVSWQLAGIAVLADWTGSNQDYFSYQSKPQDLEDYWQTALASAQKAMNTLPKPIKTRPFSNIKNLFPFIEQPTPLQEYAIKEPLSEKPQLFILEDVTGAGKTEAALTLVHRLMDKGLADGLYVALPTMATANAMYQRLGKVYSKFYQTNANQQPSLILAHGARELSESFRESVILSEQSLHDSDYQVGIKAEDQEYSATAYCNSWLADSRKKSLLADVGVGTLDQALLAVLPARHQSLRLLGLARKVLLVDEVHAYDPYMNKLLNALLEAHARQGGSAILLSATIPQQMRESLVAAFHLGLGEDSPQLIKEKEYPLITHTPAANEIEKAVDTREEVKRTVKVERINSEQDVLDKIMQASHAGQCVCWIRNTVKSARQSYQYLLGAGINPAQLSLFHSRFAMGDRQVVENQTLDRFGNKSTPEQRKGQVLIATQVVEQSLDLDFDLMITDLAPIDLIIQRAGRLQRHVRDAQGNRQIQKGAKDQRGLPLLMIFSPEPSVDATEDWLKPDHAGTQAVYSHVGQLWLTAKLLLGKDENKFTMPEDARRLIEGVYSYEAEDEIPIRLLEASFDAEAKGLVQRSMADFNVLKLSKGYTYTSGDWDEETRIPTRLTEQETVSVALAVWEGEKLKPYISNQQYAWALSTVKLPEYEWEKAKKAIPEKLKPFIEDLKEENKALRWLEVFPLTNETEDYYTAKDGFMGKIPTGVGNA